MKYLLDTNICIYYLKGLFELHEKIVSVGINNCFISEITLAELKFGIENSKKIKKNKTALNNFLSGIGIIKIFDSLDFYAKEKARLKKEGTPIDDFDLLIAAAAVTNKLTLITNNEKHFNRISSLKIENWCI